MSDSLGYRVVAVHANKGGTGKSMCAANLALELKGRGVKVALLDADLDSPYLVEIVGAKGKITLDEKRRMVPVRHDGMPLLSFALWIPDEFQGASMPGDMHDRWIRDALVHTDWGDTQLLVVDFPAGSGDEYLAVQRVLGRDLIGLVAVIPPNQRSALRRVYDTASYHHIRILGVIENMSGEVFGANHIGEYCKEKHLEFFGSIPLDARIRRANEAGDPRLPEDLRGPVQRAAMRVLEAVK